MSFRRVSALAALCTWSELSTRWPVIEALGGDPRGLLVADLADEDHVRIRAEERPAARQRASAPPWVDLDLGDARHLELDGVLDRLDTRFSSVSALERPVEGRRLAAARRAAGDHAPYGWRSRPSTPLGRPCRARRARAARPRGRCGARPARRASSGRRRCGCRSGGRRSGRSAAVLGQAALGDVELAHDLEAADHARLHRLRDRLLARSRRRRARGRGRSSSRVEVDVGRAEVDREPEHPVDLADRRGARGRPGGRRR